MEKELRFPEPFSRHIAWDTIFPAMVDVWLSVNVTKDPKTGEIVVKAVEPESLEKIIADAIKE